jgi:ubiquinone/menaquinone biosynthesis C-methylase UbiE
MPRVPNKQYNLAAPDGLIVRLLGYQRRRLYERFLVECGADPDDAVLDVGVTADRSYASSNYLEQWYPYRTQLIASGIDDGAFLEKLYPGVRFVRANGLALPFPDQAFEIVHASAVLEHVGSAANQTAFVLECCRVTRKTAFFTTPNRWYPVEVHTLLPLVHWLPKSTFRALLRKSGYGFFAEESNLNLLTSGELHAIAAQIDGFSCKVSPVTFLGWPSNLLLIAHRKK